MEFSSFDVRSAAEEAAFCALVHPQTREPLMDGDEEVGFVVLGRASLKAQEKLKKVQKAEGSRAKLAPEEEAHVAAVATAMALIVEARNISYAGKEVGSNRELIKAVLETTFPEFRSKTLEDDGVDEPFALVNAPFAFQVNTFSSRQENFLGK
jgi:hypothetical protein